MVRPFERKRLDGMAPKRIACVIACIIGADGHTPHVPALPGLHYHQRPCLPLLQRESGTACSGSARRRVGDRRIHPPCAFQHHADPAGERRAVHRHGGVCHEVRARERHGARWPDPDRFWREDRAEVSALRPRCAWPVVAAGDGGIPARRAVPHPHELLGVVRSRRASRGDLWRQPHVGDLLCRQLRRLLGQRLVEHGAFPSALRRGFAG